MADKANTNGPVAVAESTPTDKTDKVLHSLTIEVRESDLEHIEASIIDMGCTTGVDGTDHPVSHKGIVVNNKVTSAQILLYLSEHFGLGLATFLNMWTLKEKGIAIAAVRTLHVLTPAEKDDILWYYLDDHKEEDKALTAVRRTDPKKFHELKAALQKSVIKMPEYVRLVKGNKINTSEMVSA